jgi:hypothetical protein
MLVSAFVVIGQTRLDQPVVETICVIVPSRPGDANRPFEK